MSLNHQLLEESHQQYERRIVKQKTKNLLELYIGILESLIRNWLDFIQRIIFPEKKKEKEEKYAKVVNETDIL